MHEPAPSESVSERAARPLTASPPTTPWSILAFGAGALGVSLVVGCPSRQVLGVPCPGCGLTRATVALLQGDLAEVLRLHPLAPWVVALLGLIVARTMRVAVPGRGGVWLARLPQPGARAAILTAGMLIVLWFGRLFGLGGGLPDPVAFEGGAAAQWLRGALPCTASSGADAGEGPTELRPTLGRAGSPPHADRPGL